ncbi:MAG TPA: bi-domain-containing oxidoreductase [Tepidisphaeraceae bacterium]|nr:bi-domain-containing oxidoreductase [Tepidisphaeraceae bacterium]
MKQILQSYRTGELWLADVPAPAMRGCGAIVQTGASLISIGTERMITELAQKSLFGKARARPDLVKKVIAKIKTEGLSATLGKVFAKLDQPIPLGYSCAGTIVESTEPTLRPGERVACGGAGYATHAEANFVPKNLIARVPDNVSNEDAAFTTVGAIAMQGVRQADVRLGERTVVIGLGLIGLLTVQILQACGCEVFGSDPDLDRRKLAESFGTKACSPEELTHAVETMTNGIGADAVVITASTTSNAPIEQAAEICRIKGRVVVVGQVGMDVPRESFYKKELDLRLSMSYGPGRYDPNYEEGGHDYPIAHVRWTEQRNMSAFLQLVATGKVTPSKLITHRFAIDDALAAYELPGGSALGVIINYSDRHLDTASGRTVEMRSITASDRIGIGLVGAGNFAQGVLIPTLKKIDGIELIGICTSNGASGVTAATRHGFAYATTDSQKLLSDPHINLVLIATRHDSHSAFVCEALEAGKHIFVEKPLCITRQQLEDCSAAMGKHSDRCMMVGFNRRFSTHTHAVRECFASRTSPMLITYRVNAGTLPKNSWINDEKLGGGRIIGEVCHFVDWCEYIIGSVPIIVTAERTGMAENVVATLRYQDGSVATIQYVSGGPSMLPKERIEVFGDGRVAIVDDFKTTTFAGDTRPTLRTKQDKGFHCELSALIDAIKRGGVAPIPMESAVRTTKVTFAIMESIQTGRPVQL